MYESLMDQKDKKITRRKNGVCHKCGIILSYQMPKHKTRRNYYCLSCWNNLFVETEEDKNKETA